MKRTRTIFVAAFALGLVAAANAGNAADLRSPEPQARTTEHDGSLPTLASEVLPMEGARRARPWQTSVLPRITDHRPTGRPDWDIDYPSQLAPQEQR
ncbi:hypothetical protein [Dyella telluris]|uniref:Uncharacterized protein n=1 Tax=Dyella telluris TaxID=2763498 RepID=A0A7G8Q8J3_9GAMM|nr:hypothetical protein [Dyella telluris]QNK03101.1 hypothetical protein H8F01_08310 [Dyella telluris]